MFYWQKTVVIPQVSYVTALQARADYQVTQQHTERLLQDLAHQMALSKQRQEALAVKQRNDQVMLLSCMRTL